jgi:hypothetical protein
MHAITVTAPVAEGDIAAALAVIQSEHPAVAIGSYPYYRPEGYGVQLVARGVDQAAVEEAAAAIEALLRRVGAQPLRL